MRWGVLVLLWFASSIAYAQESQLHADFRREGERVADACNGLNFTMVPGCAYELFTDHPLHITAGSLPPENGFGLGGAFVADKNTKNWRLSWDADAVGSAGGAWRAGGYMKLIHTPPVVIKAITPRPDDSGGAPPKKKPVSLVRAYTVFDLYAQSISLNKLYFFGLGDDSTLAAASVFGMTQTIVGGSVVKPVSQWSVASKLNLALLGELNGRFVSIRGEHGQSFPSIETLYSNATAPGLSTQPAFIQSGEGFRIKPLIKNYFQFNYLADYRQFVAPSDSRYSFQRWTVDLNHTLYLYGYTQAASNSADTKGPDHCSSTGDKCPPIPRSRNLNGSVNLRLLVSESANSATSVVPFYFQQTLGGSDINSAFSLDSFQDYRFRAPNLLLLQQTFEHSIWGPFGVRFMADQGRVALTRGDVGFDHLKHSFAAGLTLRAGAFPMVYVMFAWGGGEGNHAIFNMNTALLGGSSRPSLD
jgi:hypothetical protein